MRNYFLDETNFFFFLSQGRRKKLIFLEESGRYKKGAELTSRGWLVVGYGGYSSFSLTASTPFPSTTLSGLFHDSNPIPLALILCLVGGRCSCKNGYIEQVTLVKKRRKRKNKKRSTRRGWWAVNRLIFI